MGKPARAESWHRRRLSAVSSTACGRKGGDGLAQRHIWEPAGSPQRGQALWTELSCGRGRAGGQGKHTGSTSGSPARRQGAGVVPPTGGAVATQSWPPPADATSQTGTPPPQAGDRRSLLRRRLPAQGFQERGRLVTRLGLDTPHGPASPPCYVEGQPGAPASERNQTVQKWGRARGRVKSGGAPHQNLLSVPTGQDAVSMMQRTGDHITTKIKELERVERGIRGHDGPGGRAKAPFQRPGPEYREAARTAGCGEVGGPCACLPEVIGSMQNAVLDQPRRWSGHGAGVGPAGADPSSSRWKASRYSLQWKNAAVRAQHAEV
nr:uncharacterized protein LOC108399786 isoform X2 [Manis javanica]